MHIILYIYIYIYYIGLLWPADEEGFSTKAEQTPPHMTHDMQVSSSSTKAEQAPCANSNSTRAHTVGGCQTRGPQFQDLPPDWANAHRKSSKGLTGIFFLKLFFVVVVVVVCVYVCVCV